jgi:zinc transport system substrate-binding protein
MKTNAALLVLVLAVVALVAALFFWPSPSQPEGPEIEEINVIVSILPQKEFVESVGGTHVIVKELIPPGASPATYDLSPKDLIAIEEADIYFRIGHIPFEDSHIEQIQSVNPDLVVVDTSESVPLLNFGEGHDGHDEHEEDEHDEDGHEGEHDELGDDHDDSEEGGEMHDDHEGHDHSGVDPHIWLSPNLVKLQVKSIQDALADMDPANAAEYASNADAYIAELDALDSELETAFNDIETNVLMVFHPAWGYFADAYGLEQIAIEQEGKEPTASQLQEVLDIARDEGVKVIFVQAQFDKSVAESVAEEIGAVVIQIDPLAEGYIQNLKTVGETISANL